MAKSQTPRATPKNPQTTNPSSSSPGANPSTSTTQKPGQPLKPPVNTPKAPQTSPEPEDSSSPDIKAMSEPPKVAPRMAKTAYSKNLAEVQAEIKKYGDFKGKFRGVEDRAVAENRDLKKKIAGQKFRIHSRPKTFRENTVWSVFDGVVKKLMAEKKTDQLSGTQIFDACKVADWSSVSRAKYTLDKAPADGWILSVIAASTTSKYRVLERIAADT